MAKLIGSLLNTGNFGEDFLCDQLVKAFDDDCVIYRNREVFGREFDVAMLIPNVGIVIFEAKGWQESSILRIENGDTIVIQTPEGEAKSSPQKQVRGYRFAIERRIRQGTGKFPLVFTMVSFPQISKAFYENQHMSVVTEEHFTLLKEDFDSKSALFGKINKAIVDVSLWNRTKFDAELMFEVRSLFETDLELCCEPSDRKEVLIDKKPRENCYSAFYYIKSSDDATYTSFVTDIADKYALGCKVFAVVGSQKYFQGVASAIDQVLNDKGLIRNKDEIQIDYAGNRNHYPAIAADGHSFLALRAFQQKTYYLI